MTEPRTHTLTVPGAELSYNVRGNDASESTPDEHADDLRRIIAALDAGPVDVFASSGGAGAAVADRLGAEPVTFPGDHAGFLGGEYGMTGKPEEFAAALRQVLAATE